LSRVALPAQPFVKVGARPPCPVVPDRLGHGLSVMVWVRGSKVRKSLSLVQGQNRDVGSGALPLFLASGARAPVPYVVGATLSDTLMVNPASVIDVFSLYTHSTIVGLTCCYKAVV